MSVIYVKEHFEGRSGEIDQKFVRTYQRAFNVRTDSYADSGPTIYNASYGGVTIPALFSSHPSDPWAYCIKKAARQGEDENWWTVTVDYSSKLDIDPLEAQENPLDRPPQIRVSTNKFTKILTEDDNDNAITNSAGDPFEGGIEVTDSRPVISLTWNKAAAGFDPITFAAFNNKVNSDTYRGFNPNELLVQDVQSEFQFENNVPFFRCSMQIEVNFDRWNPMKVLDAGFRYLGDDDKKHPILHDGQAVSSPVPLDGNGDVLEVGSDPVFLEIDIYAETSFASLP